MPPEVRHEAARLRFVATLGAGREAVLEYRAVGNGVLDYYHTFVPPEARGQGVASQLASVALEHARAHGFRVRPSCPFVARFVAAHPEHGDLLEA